MKTLITTATLLTAMACTPAMAAEVEHWSVQSGNTFVPALKVDGTVYEVGSLGLDRATVLNADAAANWVTTTLGVTADLQLGGGGADAGLDGIMGTADDDVSGATW